MCKITLLELCSSTAAPMTTPRRPRSLVKTLSETEDNAPPKALTQTAPPVSKDPDVGGNFPLLLEPPAKRARVEISAAAPLQLGHQASTSSDVSDHVDAQDEEMRTAYPLVARERECQVLDQFLGQCLSRSQRCQRGGSLYVSGGPGTGKTCSVVAAAKAWQSRQPATTIVTVNCMDLSQRSVAGLLKHIATGTLGPASSAARLSDGTTKCSNSGPGLLAAAAKRLCRFGPSVVLIVDEVDQLVGKTNAQSNVAASLDALFALPRQGSAPAIAIVAIANAVDLLDRGTVSGTSMVGKDMCGSLLFQPYDADQLRKIVRSRFEAAGDAGVAAEQAFGKMSVELRVRQVAKRSGDCRPIVQLCEQAVFEAARVQEASLHANEELNQGRPLVRPDLAHNDPLRSIQQLPMEQQVLLCALAAGTGEAVSIPDVCARYKDLCKQLHQPQNLASRDQVSDALSSLEQRGLLSLRAVKRKGQGSAKRSAGAAAMTAELAVSRVAVRDSVARANPLLKRFLE